MSSQAKTQVNRGLASQGNGTASENCLAWTGATESRRSGFTTFGIILRLSGSAQAWGLPIIGKLLGHAQSATTQRYAHLDTDPLRRAANAIGATIVSATDRDAF
jgi:triphosphoribosyl-dephospho-CoA synthetase